LDACGQFGAISYVQIGARGTALLEYEVSYEFLVGILVSTPS
jgi:hypothetical protein